jgi:hypothetical protein
VQEEHFEPLEADERRLHFHVPRPCAGLRVDKVDLDRRGRRAHGDAGRQRAADNGARESAVDREQRTAREIEDAQCVCTSTRN